MPCQAASLSLQVLSLVAGGRDKAWKKPHRGGAAPMRDRPIPIGIDEIQWTLISDLDAYKWY